MINTEIDYDDPLTDPLALDDVEHNLSQEIQNRSNDSGEESNGSITFVDIQALKTQPFMPEISSTPLTKVSYQTTAIKTIESLPIDDDLKETRSDDLNNLIAEPSTQKNPAQEIEDPAEEEVRSDGSDSGLGSEPSRNISVIEKEIVELAPLKSNLKRKLNDTNTDAETTAQKRPKKSLTFDNVTVYYFPRIQGFGCVPSQGGCTLGMESNHMNIKTFSLTEHAAEIRRAHRQQMLELNAAAGLGPMTLPSSSSSPALSSISTRNSSSEDTDSDEEPSENSGSEADSESYGFLQPVSTRQRRALLKASGIRAIDVTEKDECRLIRSSREVCGCTCRGYCDPDTCECSQSGIKCQVDRQNFPCGCTRDGCANGVGRVEFNPGRVRTHFIHTVMRLELEKKQKTEDSIGASNSNFNKVWPSGPPTLQPQPMQIPQLNLNYTNSDNNLDQSIDLHYAFRDDFTASAIDNTGVVPAAATIVINNTAPTNYSLDKFNHNSIPIYNTDYTNNYPNYLVEPNSYTHYQYDTDVGSSEFHSNLQLPSSHHHSHSPLLLGSLQHIPITTTAIGSDVISLNTPEMNTDRIDDLIANNRNIIYSPDVVLSNIATSSSTKLLESPLTTIPTGLNNYDENNRSVTLEISGADGNSSEI